MYTHIYRYIYIHTHMYIYIYLYTHTVYQPMWAYVGTPISWCFDLVTGWRYKPRGSTKGERQHVLKSCNSDGLFFVGKRHLLLPSLQDDQFAIQPFTLQPEHHETKRKDLQHVYEHFQVNVLAATAAQIALPNTACGLVIGKGGAVQREILEKTGRVFGPERLVISFAGKTLPRKVSPWRSRQRAAIRCQMSVPELGLNL